MATGPFVADIPGAFERGRQFRQAEQLRPLQQQQQQQGLQLGGIRQRAAEQGLVTGGLQQQALQQQIDIRSDQEKTSSLLNAALTVDTLQDAEIAPFLRQHIATVEGKGGDASSSIKALALAEAGDFDTVRSGAKNLIDIGVRQGDIKAPAQKPSEQFTLSQGQQRFGPTGELIAEVAPREAAKAAAREQAVIPPALLTGLDPDLAVKGSAAFTAAGGGKDGLTAFQKIVDQGTEQQRRLASPQILKSSFPQASEAETVQLQAAMDAAKTTEAGLKAAKLVRADQRRTKKAKSFQERAVTLLDNILGSDELEDVLGSIEGAIDFRLFSDEESQVISDIEEAGNILTADNLDLMSGVLSETDIKILANLAGGALNRKRSEKRFRADVTKLRDKLASQQVVTVDDTAQDRSQAGELQEGAIIRNPTTGQRMQVTNGQLVEIQ